jgi:nitrite reductase/ring-hydroxylating ferredoxin subunit
MSTALCRLEEIPDGEGRNFVVDSGKSQIFVVRQGDRIHGYVNSCPHIGTPLDWIEDQFMTLDKQLILCATHGAQFRIADGYCVSGPCEGDSLQSISVVLQNGIVTLVE